MELVSPKRRICAVLIDFAIMGVIALIFSGILIPSRDKILANADSMEELVSDGAFWQRVSCLISAVVMLSYMSIEIFKSATPGKMILGLRVAKRDGSAADRQTLLKRFAVKNVACAFQVLAFITTLNFVLNFSAVANLALLVAFGFAFRASRVSLYDEYLGTAVYRCPATAAVPATQPAAA